MGRMALTPTSLAYLREETQAQKIHRENSRWHRKQQTVVGASEKPSERSWWLARETELGSRPQ